MVESKNKIIWKGSQILVCADDVKDPVLSAHQQSMIQCQICMMILQEPQECEKCQNQFCLACIKEWEQSLKRNYKQSECPLRCKPLKYTKSHKFVRSLLDELKISCPNLEKGCADVVKIYDLENHQNLCQWEITKCNGFLMCKFQDYRCRIPAHIDQCIFVFESCIYCKENIQRRDKVKHFEKKCPEAPKTCEFCEQNFARKDLRKHRWNDCDQYPETCEFCNTTILRKDIKKHIETCDFQPYKCELCGFKLKLKDVTKHLNDECPEEIAFNCKSECKLSIKRKYLKDGKHDCVKYLQSQLYMVKQKSKFLKAQSEHQDQVDKALVECELCKKDSKLAPLAKRPLDSIKIAFSNITSIFLGAGLRHTESKPLKNQINLSIISVLQNAYLNMECIAFESNYQEFSYVERKQYIERIVEEEKKQEDLEEQDIFGFRMNDEVFEQEFNRAQNPPPIFQVNHPYVAVINRPHEYYEDDDEDLFGTGIFGYDY